MSLLELYRLRRDIAQTRQAAHIKEYDELHDFLVSLGKTQSYDLGFGTKLKFEELKFYPNDTFGRDAKIPSSNFIYRTCSIVDIVKGTEWRKDEGTDLKNWNQVHKKSKGRWTPLSEFADGEYRCNPRHFSWWTSFPLDQDVISGAHRVGMTNDWVAEECVVLRCPVEYVNKNNLAFVPSIIDAFMQMIFHPTMDEISPPYGITIDLSFYPHTLAPGIDEVVLREIPVEQLEVFPVFAGKKYREGKHEVNSDFPQFTILLEYYYQKLCEGCYGRY